MDIPSLFERSIARTPQRDAIVDVGSNRRFTYTELDEAIAETVAGLREIGVERGDRVAICMANRPEHAMAFLATQRLGAIAVSFNFRLPAGDIVYHVEDSEADVLLFDSLSREAVVDARGDFECEHCIYVGKEPPEFAASFEDVRTSNGDSERVDVDPDELSVILYTSGTTGDPKGIPITHEASFARAFSNSLGQGYYLRECMLGVMPLYHTVGLHGIFCSMMVMSGTYLSMPEFNPAVAVEAIGKEGVTALHEAPTIFKHLVSVDGANQETFETVETIAYSGAPMSTELFETLDEVIAPKRFTNIYGNTETYDPLEFVDLREAGNPRVAGNSHTFHRTRIVELDSFDPDATVDPGTEGELIVHTESPAAFDAYLNKPEETKRAIADGWYFTGDVAYETAEGTIIVTGRADDLIISGGENIHPAEIEDVIVQHPNVEDVGVIGVPDEEWGEIVKAYVQGDVTADELDQWCLDSDDLADFKRPREYEFLEQLPRNPSGKIMRYQLRGRE